MRQNKEMAIILKRNKYTRIAFMLGILNWINLKHFIQKQVLVFI